MRTIRFLALVALLFVSPAFAAASLGQIRISLLQGEVQMRTAEGGEWVPSSANSALAEGDELWVPEGARVELQLRDGTYVRLDQSSALEILATDKDSSQFFLSQGRAYVYFDGEPGAVLQFDTPQVSAHARTRCAFDVALDGDYTDVSAYKGYVDVENQTGSTRLNAGKELSLGRDTEAEIAPLGALDEWETWNRTRNDRLLAEGPSLRYLPPELRTYRADFDGYGQWVEIPEYGWVWVPETSSSSDWSPYRNGRWVWRGGDYVWVGYEPWGWVPYHFGRWAFAGRFGWCWVPPPRTAVIWGPGFVGWVRTPDYVAWVPLAPRETYYGHGDYGPHCVNVMRVNTADIRITGDYRNGRVRHGVTIVHHDTFVRGAPPPVPFNPEEVRRRVFSRGNMVAGRPSIPPVRASFMPVVKPIPLPFLPPPRIAKSRAERERPDRPLARRPGESALRPGIVAQPLPVKDVPVTKMRARDAERGERPGKAGEVRSPYERVQGEGERGAGERFQRREEPKRAPFGRPQGEEATKPGKEKRTLPPKGVRGSGAPPETSSPAPDDGKGRGRSGPTEETRPNRREQKARPVERPEMTAPPPREEGDRPRGKKFEPQVGGQGARPDRPEAEPKGKEKPPRDKGKGRVPADENEGRADDDRGRGGRGRP